MRHRVKGKLLNRDTDHRKALRLALTSALIRHERIQTTRAKAEFVRDHVEKLVTKAKQGLVMAEDKPERGVHARRIVASRLNNDRELVGKLFDTIAPRYKERPGGYTRILKLGPRKGDAAEMVLLEFVDRDADAGSSAS
ncbi:50S ribosomal protein L17 [Anaerolineae bacterium CFX9]|nr:50S ribosomal protein L17 [Anaerolineae bacterium CFX9]